MPSLRRARRTGPPLLAASIAGAAALALLPATAGAVGAPQQREGRGSADVRAVAGQAGATTHAARVLTRQLGPQAVVQIDPTTGTPRTVGRTDGALTGRSGDAPDAIALDWVRDRPGLFGLDERDLDALGEPRRVVTPSGMRIVSWRQSYGGIPVAGAGLTAAVAADGRLVSLHGAPVRETAVASTTPSVSAAAAMRRARGDADARDGTPRVRRSAGGPRRTTAFADGSTAGLVVVPGRDRNRLAWDVTAHVDSTHIYSYLIDARSGAVLKRENMVRFNSGNGHAWTYAPSPLVAANDGHVQSRRAFGDDWLFENAPTAWLRSISGVDWAESVSRGRALLGNNAWAYPDVFDDNAPSAGDQVPANDDDGGAPALPVWRYELSPFSGPSCLPDFPCTWRPGVPNSWTTNLEQNAVQAFWAVNTFAEHLRADPIGFDERSGNFQFVNTGEDGWASDGVLVETSDGASTGAGLPDGNHINNANMWTPPDGWSPAMQMYLFDGGIAGNGGDDAAVVYHEYTHGLSNRIVIDEGTGKGALTSPQAGAMGEAWSDWYALDYLVGDGATGYQADDPGAPGELVLAASLTRGENWLRESALDCPVGVEGVDTCPQDGGFTYADYGSVSSGGGPEVHADGEIWAQTLWDLRAALIARYGTDEGVDGVDGIDRARQLITDGMRITPDEPTFLDARNAILRADVANGSDPARGPDHDLIWDVFARRGMGWFAASDGPYDAAPLASFELPPTKPATATLSGTVTDADTGAPIAGATVRLPGSEIAATSGADGRYTLSPVVPMTYPRLLISQAGYDAPAANVAVTVDETGSVRDVALRRNWARYDGGAVVLAGIDPDIGGACAAENGIDGSLAYGWASYAPGWDGVVDDPPRPPAYPNGYFPDSTTGPREMVVMLPRGVDISSFLIDPGAICGDDDSASLGEFTIETADDTQQYRLAFDGQTADGRFERADRPNHRLHTLSPIAGTTTAVRFVRITMIRPQGGGGAGSSGVRFMDLAEFGIHGTATPESRDPDPRDPDPRDPDPRQPDPRQPEPRQPDPRQPEPRQPEPRRPADRRAPRAVGKPLVPKRRALTALRGRAGLPVRVRFDEAARISATVTLPAATARKLGLTKARRGTFRLSRGALRGRLAARRWGTVRLKLSARARRRLARARSLRVRIAIVATDAAGNSRRIVVKPLLRR